MIKVKNMHVDRHVSKESKAETTPSYEKFN